MKNVLFLIVTALMVMGCGGDDGKKEELSIGTVFDGYELAAGVTPFGVAIDQIDTTKYIILGMVKEGIWEGEYERQSKSKLSQKVYPASFPKTVTVKKENGELETSDIVAYQSPTVQRIHDNIVFTLYAQSKDNSAASIYLCRLSNGALFKKEYDTDIRASGWYGNLYFAVKPTSPPAYYVMDENFNKLFDAHKDYSYAPRIYIDNKNIIYYQFGKFGASDELIRENIADGEEQWTTAVMGHADTSNYKFAINNSILTFSCNYIMDNGVESTLTKKLDINTGKIIE